MHYSETLPSDWQHSHFLRKNSVATLAGGATLQIKQAVGLGVRGAVPGNHNSQQPHWVTE